jgi:hypothetical protein
LITGSSASAFDVVKEIFLDRFFMTDMSPLRVFLGIEINQDALGINSS